MLNIRSEPTLIVLTVVGDCLTANCFTACWWLQLSPASFSWLHLAPTAPLMHHSLTAQPHSVAKLLPPQTQCVGGSDWLLAPVYRGCGPMTGLVTNCGPGGRVSCMYRDREMRLRLRTLATHSQVSDPRPGPGPRDPGHAGPPVTRHCCFICIFPLSVSLSPLSPLKREICEVKSNWIILQNRKKNETLHCVIIFCHFFHERI